MHCDRFLAVSLLHIVVNLTSNQFHRCLKIVDAGISFESFSSIHGFGQPNMSFANHGNWSTCGGNSKA